MFTLIGLIYCLAAEIGMILYGYGNIDRMTDSMEEIREYNKTAQPGKTVWPTACCEDSVDRYYFWSQLLYTIVMVILTFSSIKFVQYGMICIWILVVAKTIMKPRWYNGGLHRIHLILDHTLTLIILGFVIYSMRWVL